MTDLVEFLRTQNDATRAAVEQLADKPDWPAWVLAQCDAVDALLDRHQPDREPDRWYWPQRACKECGRDWHAGTPAGTPPHVIGPVKACPTLRMLAMPYAWHPGYREEWRS